MKENLLTGMETDKDIAAFIVEQQIAKSNKSREPPVKTQTQLELE
jgi:hypothetical protein